MIARTFMRVAALVVVLALSASGPASAAPRRIERWTTEDTVLILPAEPFTDSMSVPDCADLEQDTRSRCFLVEGTGVSLFVQIHASLPIDEVLVSRNWAIRVARLTEDRRAMTLALTTPTDLENDETSLLYADVTHAIGDLTSDGNPEVVLGYRSEGTGQILDLDIVGLGESGVVEVLAHAQLYKGTAKIKHGTLVTWMPIYKKSDANCCPTWIRRDVVRYEDGAFVVHTGKKVPTAKANIPAGDL